MVFQNISNRVATKKDTVFILKVRMWKGTVLYRRFMEGLAFLSKVVYQRLRVWGSKQSLSMEKFIETSPPPPSLGALVLLSYNPYGISGNE